ncbi:hypothetical protein IKG_05973 [Bacillus cereus VD200]|nr:hypothetical protein IKG_05973 [Bacillus cereus VD200]
MKQFKKFVYAVVCVFLFSAVPPVAADSILTVDDAIQTFQNEGKKPAIVEGYIVGYTQSTGKYTKDPMKFGNTNIAIAASLYETNAQKIISVQIASGSIQKSLNLKEHPENIGKKVTLTGTIDSYFNSPGMKSVTDYAFSTEETSVVQTVMASQNAGEIEKGTAITLTTATEGAKIYYTVDGSIPTENSLLYQKPIVMNDDSVIKASAFKEGSKPAPMSVFTFTMMKNESVQIHDIQGKSHISPYNKRNVKGVIGVVTWIGKDGFYMQDPNPDDDLATSEGIYVYKKEANVKIGDLVQVDGQVEEFIGQGYADRFETDLSITEIKAKVITVKAEGQELPKAVIFGESGVKIPDKIIDNDAFDKFDPAEDAIDFYESLEGMLVKMPKPTIIAPQKNGNLYVTVANSGDKITTKWGTPVVEEDNENPERLSLKVGRNYVAKSGDRIDGDVTGIVGYDYANYRILPIEELPPLQDGGFKTVGATIQPRMDKLTVATYNIENFSANVQQTSDEKVKRLAYAIKYNLKMPDIIGVQEMQDNNGTIDDGTTDASLSAQRLVNAIREIRGPEYEYVDISPENNKDGGAPGANIRVGFFYNKSRVKLAKNPVLLEKNIVSVGKNISTFDNTRKPLAAEFTFQGKNIVVISSHLNSKLGDASPFGKIQPVVLKSEEKRIELAKEVNHFVKEIQNREEGAPVVVVGDMNDVEFSKPMQALKGSIMKEMLETVPKKNRYTYIHDGNAQALDHIFVTKNIAPFTIVDPVHLNSNIMETHGRMSDHDPVLAQINLKKSL